MSYDTLLDWESSSAAHFIRGVFSLLLYYLKPTYRFISVKLEQTISNHTPYWIPRHHILSSSQLCLPSAAPVAPKLIRFHHLKIIRVCTICMHYPETVGINACRHAGLISGT